MPIFAHPLALIAVAVTDGDLHSWEAGARAAGAQTREVTEVPSTYAFLKAQGGDVLGVLRAVGQQVCHP